MSEPTKEAPEAIELRAPARPVARLNRRMLVILSGMGTVAVLMTIWWTLSPHPAASEHEAETASPPAVSKAEGLSRMPKDYSGWQVPQLGPPAGELGRPVLRAERAAGIRDFRPDEQEDHLRVLRLREQEEAEAATKAKVFFQLNRRTAPSASFDKVSNPSEIPQNSGPALASPSPDSPNGQRHNEGFLKRAGERSIYATGTLQTPRSPYQLLAGTIIPAALLTGINSDLPGEVLASVTESVFDSVTGQYLLIPQGSRIIGQYDSEVAFGQRRVLLVWTRLIMPDGSSIVLDRLPGMDTQGRAGLEDGVDRHWGRIFSGAALSTLLGINAELAARNRNDGSIVIATRNSAQDSVNQLGQELTRRNADLQPTLTIRPGFALRIMINRDLILRAVAGS